MAEQCAGGHLYARAVACFLRRWGIAATTAPETFLDHLVIKMSHPASMGTQQSNELDAWLRPLEGIRALRSNYSSEYLSLDELKCDTGFLPPIDVEV